MAEKIKLGIVGDAGVPTGFATVTHNMASYLQETGDYDIQIIGINFDGQPNDWSKKFQIWPARMGGDFLGVGLIPRFVEEVKPDCFMMFQDFWNIPLYIGALPPDQPGSFAYYPVDAPNIKGQYMIPMGAICHNACYTNFGVQESIRGVNEAWDDIKFNAKQHNFDVVESFSVQVGAGFDPITRTALPPKVIKVYAKRFQTLRHPESYSVIPHGVDTKAFYPVAKKGARKALGLPLDGFYVGNVNRNQSRKRIDLTIKAFANFYKTHPDARLLLHCVMTDVQGWDLEQLARFYNVRDRVIFSHGLFKNMTASITQLNLLYNALDVQVNTGGGEGWGLTSFEGAAAKVPQVVPNWSATTEIWGDAAKLLKVCEVRHEPATVNTMQAVVDTNHVAEVLSELYDSPQLREEVGNKCFEVTQRPEYTWEAVGKKFDEVFKKIAGTKPLGGPVALTTKGQLDLQKAGILK
jgi:D-inositol-3-phosphate glycosyltransferase